MGTDPLRYLPADSFRGRLFGALRHDVPTIAAIARDEGATREAALIVGLIGIFAGIRLMFEAIGEEPFILGLTLVSTIILVFLGWFIFSVVAYLIGFRLLPAQRADTSVRGLLRALGFASAPLILGIYLSFIPALDAKVFALVVLLWFIVGVFITLRTVLEVSTARALVIGLVAVCVTAPIMVIAFSAIMPVEWDQLAP